jgi:hypothetical protein
VLQAVVGDEAFARRVKEESFKNMPMSEWLSYAMREVCVIV